MSLDSTGLKEHDISCEAWREYDFPGRKVYTIYFPQQLSISKSGTTHRVVDSEGIVHCLPAPGHQGCVLRWKNREGEPKIKF